jgi:hypothetical protein
MKKKQPISVTRGRSASRWLTITDEDGNPYVLSDNETLEFGVKKRATHDQCILRKTLTVADMEEDGRYLLYFYPEDTKDLTCGKYFYDLALYVWSSADSGVEFWDIITKNDFILGEDITRYDEVTSNV